jgi:DNA-binding XRE family transcriptional regulator
MNKIDSFLRTNFHYIALFFLIFNFFSSCDREVGRLSKRIGKLEVQVDSLTQVVVTRKDLKIEGLRTEKRMIQSTDRKILDVNRQTEIDKEIDLLSK